MVFKNIYLLEKIFFYSYRRKIIDKQHFPYIFNGQSRYFGGVTLMSFNQLSLISSWVQILYCMNVTSLSISPQLQLYMHLPYIFNGPFRFRFGKSWYRFKPSFQSAVSNSAFFEEKEL